MSALAHALRTWDDVVDGFVGHLKSALAAEAPHTLAVRLTLLLVVLHGTTSPFAAVVARSLGLVMLVLPPLAMRSSLWWLLALTLVASNIDQWELVDNHQYLMTYWVLGCAITRGRPAEVSATARILVGIAFVFAAAWKVVAGQYWDGSFFYWTFLTDGRLQNVAAFIEGSNAAAVRDTIDAIGQFTSRGMVGAQLIVENHGRIFLTALAMSWLGLVLEALIGILHFLPGQRWYLARHVALMTFVAVTYFLLPVTGFGFLLAVMGFAQLRAHDDRLKGWYFVLLCFLQLTLVPWRNLLSVSS